MYKRILLLLLISGSLMGQNSNYSSYGFGLPAPYLSVRSLGLGNTGAAISDSLSLNIANPALWNGFATTSLQGQAGSSMLENQQGILTQFLGFSVKFPVGDKVGLAMGITPVTRMEGGKSFTDSSSFGATVVNYSSDVQVSGGISQFFIGGGYRISPRFQLGLKAQVYFGNYLTKMDTDLDDGSIKSYFKKYTIVQGVQIGTGSYWISKDRKSGLALYLDYPLKFESYRMYDFYFGDDSTTSHQAIPYPAMFQLGVRRQISKSLTFSADVSHSIVSGSLLKDFYVLEKTEAKNPFYIGFGLEKEKPYRPGTTIWQQMALRGGAYYKSEMIYQSGGLKESGISIGVGLPFMQNLNRIDLAIVAAIRDGFLNNTYGKEKVLSVYISVTTGELWFRKFKRF
ncbi:MAG: hypothetical protein J7L86_08045 [Candidatus Marinimicrobia bacterium]|nr:hypothetical protein [Candidatus Neomarinimicrobiota bacterium]